MIKTNAMNIIAIYIKYIDYYCLISPGQRNADIKNIIASAFLQITCMFFKHEKCFLWDTPLA